MDFEWDSYIECDTASSTYDVSWLEASFDD